MSVALIIGPMHSGKTTALLDEAARINSVGLKVLFVNSAKDIRTSDEVSTHNPIVSYKEKLKNVYFVKVSNLGGLDISGYHSILIDEAQFFDDLLDSVIKFVEVDKKNVIVSGLSGNYQRRKFGQILDLIPLVDNPDRIIYKTAYCVACAKDNKLVEATFSQRLNKEEMSEIAISSNKCPYISVCGTHFNVNQ